MYNKHLFPKPLLIGSLGVDGSCQDTYRMWMWTNWSAFRELKNRKCSDVIRNGWRYWASELSWKEKTSYNLEACTFCFALESKTGEIEFQGCKHSPLKQARAFYRLCVHYGSELLYQGSQKWYNGVGVVSKV